MFKIRRHWTPEAADEWTKEDLIVCILSCLSYIALAIGVAFSLLLQWYGFVILLVGFLIIFFMFFIIDPKLHAISTEYEKKQKEYLNSLEKIEKWEE